MRLCVLSHAYVEASNLPILASIAAQPGIELALITPDRYMLHLQSSDGTFSQTAQPYKIYPVPIRFGRRQGAFLYHRKPLEQALDDFAPDILLHEQEVFALGALQIARLARRRGLPLVMQVAENLTRALILPRRRVRDFVLRQSDGLICWNRAGVRVHQTWGYTGLTAVIPGMANAFVREPLHAGRRSGDALHVCFAGRLVASKGVDCLLHALALLKARGTEASCSIAGHGPERAALEALTRQLGLADHVRFLGVLPQDEVFKLLRSSDVLVLPSRRTPVWEEQFGRVLPQAMNEGAVTVGTRTGAIPEVIGRDDLLFNEDNAPQLAAILERLASNETYQKDCQQSLFDRAASLYLNDVLAAQKVEFCARVFAELRNSQRRTQ